MPGWTVPPLVPYLLPWTQDFIIDTGFNPSKVDNLKLWLDASDLPTITKDSNNKVSAWLDKSKNNANVLQATGTTQPIYTLATINTQPAVVFDGVDDFLVANIPAWQSVSTVFTVHKANTTGLASGGVFSNAAATVVSSFTLDYSASKYRFLGTKDDNTSTGTVAIEPTANNTSPTVVSCILNGSNISNNYNGSTTTSSGSTILTPNFTVYRLGRTRVSAFGNVSIGTILIYSRVLTSSEINAITNYLGTKYGVTIT